MFFVSYEAYEPGFLVFWKRNKVAFTSLFNAVVLNEYGYGSWSWLMDIHDKTGTRKKVRIIYLIFQDS